MERPEHRTFRADGSAHSNVSWLEEFSEVGSEDLWDVFPPGGDFSRTFRTGGEVTNTELYEEIDPVVSHGSTSELSQRTSESQKRGRRTSRPRIPDRISPEKSIARERSTVDSAGNITLMTETVYKCHKCDKTFYTRSGYRKHQKNHSEDDRNVCAECGQTFSDHAGLSLHKEVHLEDKPWTCPSCHKHFRLPSHLAKHQRSHTGHRPYTCKVCGTSFSQSSNLASHMKSHGRPYKTKDRQPQGVSHRTVSGTGGRAYTCPECGRGFGRNAHLASHRRVHVGVKPHCCPHCGESFRSRSDLLLHHRRFSGGSGRKSSPCGGCGLHFSTCDSYTNHSCVLLS